MSLINFTLRRDWNSRYHLTHRYIQALCAAVFLAISRRSVFEFHLSVTKECVFHSPTPAPPETAAGSHKNSILWCIFQLLSSEKLPFFLFSIFHHVLQRRLCSHDIDTWKCLAGKLLDPFFHPLFNKFSAFPWSVTWVWAMWYQTSDGNKGLHGEDHSPT